MRYALALCHLLTTDSCIRHVTYYIYHDVKYIGMRMSGACAGKMVRQAANITAHQLVTWSQATGQGACSAFAGCAAYCTAMVHVVYAIAICLVLQLPVVLQDGGKARLVEPSLLFDTHMSGQLSCNVILAPLRNPHVVLGRHV